RYTFEIGVIVIVAVGFAADIEPRQPYPATDREDQNRDPCRAAIILKRPEIKDKCGRRSEIHEIGKRIEFRAKPAATIQQTRNAPTQPVKNTGKDDKLDRKNIIALNTESNGRQPRANRGDSQHVRQQL